MTVRPSTNILYDSVGTPFTGSTNGTVFAFNTMHDDRTHHVVTVDIQAGTGTVQVQGRNGPDSAWAALATIADTDTDRTKVVVKMKQLRVVISTATAIQARVTTDYTGKPIS